MTIFPWRQHEIFLTSDRTYADPYLDVEVWIDFVHESGVTLRRGLLGRRREVADSLCADRDCWASGAGAASARWKMPVSPVYRASLSVKLVPPVRIDSTDAASGGCRREDATWFTPMAPPRCWSPTPRGRCPGAPPRAMSRLRSRPPRKGL